MKKITKMKAFRTWTILVGSLPRGIVAFVIAVAGLSVGLPLAVFVIGLPILAGMLTVCERILGTERRLVAGMDNPMDGNSLQVEKLVGINKVEDITKDSRLKNWRGWLEVLEIGRASCRERVL